MTFHVGQKVVCIKACGARIGNVIKEGTILTIRDKPTAMRRTGRIMTGLLFQEVHNKKGINGWEPDYSMDKFRPLVDDHKGMTTLRSILNNPKQKIKSDQFDKEKV